MQSYVVKRGDSFSKLSARFNVPLAALVKVNGKRRDINLILEGETIKVPRSLEKYDEIIASFEELMRETDRDYRERMMELQRLEAEAATFGGRIDLAADLATGLLGFRKAIVKYGGIVQEAALRKQTFDAAQKLLVHLVGEQDPGDSAKVMLKATGAATADQYLRSIEKVGPVDKKQFAGTFAKDAGKAATKAVAKHLVMGHVAVDKQAGTEMVVNLVVHAAIKGMSKASDVAGAISPSNVAHVWMGLRDEDLRTTVAKSRQAVTTSHERVIRSLTERSKAIMAERNAAYA